MNQIRILILPVLEQLAGFSLELLFFAFVVGECRDFCVIEDWVRFQFDGLK